MDYQVNYRKKPSRARALFLGIFTGLLFLGAATEGFVAYKMTHDPATLGVSTKDTTSENELILPAKPGLQAFVSQKYGYGFYYQSQASSPEGTHLDLDVSELNNASVVVTDSLTHRPSRIIEAFKKDTNDSLADAIKRQFFNGLNPTSCKIDQTTIPDDKNFPSDFIVATILTQSAPPQATVSATPACPAPYIQKDSDHPRFFIMDPKHQGIFLFIDNSESMSLQAVTDSGQIINWFDTITFLR